MRLICNVPSICHKVLSLVLLSIIMTGGLTPVEADERLVGLEEYIEESLLDWDLPGMSVAVVYDDKVLFADGVGVKQLGKSEEIDGDTLLQIGSTSKAFGAAAVAVLVDEGLLDWDDKIIQHLPWFETVDQDVMNNATIRDLLRHTSGVGGAIETSVKITTPTEAAKLLSLQDESALKRGNYLYSNSGYGLTQVIIEQVTGQSWKDLVESRIFEPLSMKDSATTPYDVWDDEYVAPVFLGSAPAGLVDFSDTEFNVAMPHGRDSEGGRTLLPWQSYDTLAPAGNIVSSARDMAQWLRLWLNEGVVDGKRVLSQDVIREMSSPQTDERGGGYFLYSDETESTYGLGWSQQTFQGRRIVYHGGGIFGFPAYVMFFPDEGLGISVLANGNTLSPYYPHQAVAAWVAERLLDLEERDWHTESLTGLENYKKIVTQRKADALTIEKGDLPPTFDLETYVGEYEGTNSLGIATIDLKDGQLHFRLSNDGELAGVLEHWQEDAFRLDYCGGDGIAWDSFMGQFQIEEGLVKSIEFEILGKFTKL